MVRRAVHVRGAGALTPLGSTWPESRAALAAGRCAIETVRHFDVADFPC